MKKKSTEPTKSSFLIIRLEPALHSTFKRICFNSDLVMSKVVRTMLGKWISRRQKS